MGADFGIVHVGDHRLRENDHYSISYSQAFMISVLAWRYREIEPVVRDTTSAQVIGPPPDVGKMAEIYSGVRHRHPAIVTLVSAKHFERFSNLFKECIRRVCHVVIQKVARFGKGQEEKKTKATAFYVFDDELISMRIQRLQNKNKMRAT